MVTSLDERMIEVGARQDGRQVEMSLRVSDSQPKGVSSDYFKGFWTLDK